MQSLYMEFVSARDRKVFGEYYTPDWLASLIVREALDEMWRSRAIEQAETSARTSTRLDGVGVLDPTCGSGTFLYHAARRILDAPEMRELSPGRQADITASLVHGIDVHPVAVEIAKTNMMRVLPTTPTAGAAAIQIRMGDSLMADNQSTSVFDVEGTMRILTPKGRQISLPMSFVRRSSFAEDMGLVVGAAVDKQQIAPAVLIGLETADLEDLKRARDELAETIDDEGNSVWTWYAVNLAGPHLLSEQKVDRIVANPPWVKLSEIQHVPRKRAMERFGQNLGIYQGGKQAPHPDIAAFFIRRARELYLKDARTNPAIWLVKKSSLRAGHWAAFRELHHDTLVQSVDLEDIQPFGGGDARRTCLLLDHRPMAGTTARELAATRTIDESVHQRRWTRGPIEHAQGPPTTGRNDRRSCRSNAGSGNFSRLDPGANAPRVLPRRRKVEDAREAVTLQHRPQLIREPRGWNVGRVGPLVFEEMDMAVPEAGGDRRSGTLQRGGPVRNPHRIPLPDRGDPTVLGDDDAVRDRRLGGVWGRWCRRPTRHALGARVWRPYREGHRRGSPASAR